MPAYFNNWVRARPAMRFPGSYAVVQQVNRQYSCSDVNAGRSRSPAHSRRFARTPSQGLPLAFRLSSGASNDAGILPPVTLSVRTALMTSMISIPRGQFTMHALQVAQL